MNLLHSLSARRVRLAVVVIAGLAGVVAASWSRPDRVWQGQEALDELDRRGEKASLMAAFEAARYAARPIDARPGAFVAVNRTNKLRAEFTRDAVAIETTGGARTTVRPVGVGYGDALQKMEASSIKADGARVEIGRTKATDQVASIKEWWVNRPSGLEQGYTVGAAPGHRKAGEWLRVALAIESSLQLGVAADGQSATLEDADGNAVLRYDHLVVTDAKGRTLPSRMRGEGATLSLETDDTNAVYPITIDPTWAQEAYLKASNPDASDNFGMAVAVSGNKVVIGAPGEDSTATGVNGNQSNNSAGGAGAAYVFARSGGNWSLEAYLKASNSEANDNFGIAVAISGNTIVVGANNESSQATGVNGNQADNSAATSGAAYVFVYSGTWTQQAYLKASNTGANDLFGGVVAISGDTIVVGAQNEDSSSTGVNGVEANETAAQAGAAYVFVRNGITWTQQAYLKASNTGAGDFYSQSVSVSGDTIVVGANNEDSAATGVDGNQADNTAVDSGAAYVYVRNAGVWTQQAYLKASNTGGSDFFGTSVTVSGDTVIAGAWGEDGSARVVNGTSDNAAAGAGAAYVFVRNAGVWSQQAYLKAANTSGGYSFGIGIALDGDTAVVGAPDEDINAAGVNGPPNGLAVDSGSAYVFTRNSGVWSQQSYLKASNTGGSDRFGLRTSISGTTLVVGAYQEDSAANVVNGDGSSNATSNSGAAYTFDIGGTITGTVVNQATLAAVQAASVSFFTANGTLLSTVSTNPSGVYTSPGLVPGSYFVRVISPAGSPLIGELYNDLPCPNGVCTILSGTKVTVTASNATTADFGLSAGARISGTVTNASTLAAVSGASVGIFTLNGTSIQTLTTDGAGAYTSPALPTGSYLVRALPPTGSALLGQLHSGVSCPLSSCTVTNGTPVVVTSPNTTAINFALQTGATITGTVTKASDGTPVSGVTVAVFPASGGTALASVTTNGSGQYTSPGVTTGSYLVRAAPAAASGLVTQLHNGIACPGSSCNVTIGTPVAIAAPNATPVNFALQQGGTITGTVTNATTLAGVSGATVSFFTQTGAGAGSTTTDANGLYTSPPLSSGTYVVRADPTTASALIGELYNNIPCPGTSCTVASGAPVAVAAPSATPNINFALDPGAVIAGFVTNELANSPVSGTTLSFFNPAGNQVGTNQSSGAGGGYNSFGLPTGQYFVRAIPPAAYGLVGEQHNNVACPAGTCANTTGTLVTATMPSVTPINFPLAAGGTITGTVTIDSTVTPVAGATVGFFNSAGTSVGTATTDGLGVYTSPVLSTGTYYVRVVPLATSGLMSELHNDVPCPAGTCTVTTGTGISVTAPNSTVVNFGLAPGATISGIVTNATTGLPAGGVTVRFYNSTGTSLVTVVTDAAGAYVSPGLQSGSYLMRVEASNASGLVWQMYNNIQCPNGSCTIVNSTPLAVTAPNNTPVNFSLLVGATIAGTVTNGATFAPVPGVTVTFFTSTGTTVGTFTTDVLGRFSSQNLPTGSYYVRAAPPAGSGLITEQFNNFLCVGSTCSATSGNSVSVTAPNVTPLDFELAPGARISGNVTAAATGDPVGGATVVFYNNGGTSMGSVTTDALGNYISMGLPTGSYFMRVEPVAVSGLVWQMYNGHNCPGGGCSVTNTTPIAVTAPNATTNINFSVVRGGTITGTVTNAVTTAPVSGIQINIVSPSGSFVTSVTTNAIGNYTTSALPEGQYFVVAGVNSTTMIGQLHNGITCFVGGCSAITGTPVGVSAPNATTINFALQPGATISGTVTNSGTLAPVSGVTVTFFNSGGTNIGSTTTDALGAYTSPGLATGSYFVRAAPSATSGVMAELYNNLSCVGNTCAVTTGTPVAVTAPTNTANINFALDPGATISGVVTHAISALPVAGVTVTFFNSAGTSVGSATTDANGAYTSPALPTGSYFIRALPSVSAQLIGELYDNIPCPGGACQVTTGLAVPLSVPTPTTNVNFALQPGGNIAGFVTDASTGAPVAGVTVSVFAGGTNVATLTTDQQGGYTTAGLATGNYTVRAVPPVATGLLSQLHNGQICLLGTCSTNNGTPVPVTAPNSTPVNFALVRGAMLSGVVTDALTEHRQSGVSVAIFSSLGVNLTTLTTDPQGVYRAPVLPSGTYYLRALPPNVSNLMGELHNNVPCPFGSCFATNGTPLQLTAPSETTVDFELEVGATISGTVTQSGTGTPVVGATVQFFTNVNSSAGSTTTNSLGAYISPGLLAGSYFVRVTPPAGSTLVGELHNNLPCPGGTCSPTAGAPVVVTVPNSTVVNFALDLGATISGVVTNETTGLPVPGVTVSFTQSGIFSIGSTTTDSNGAYTSPGLPTGSAYRLRAIPPGSTGLIAEVYDNISCPANSCHGGAGTPVTVTAPNVTNINFALTPGATITGKVTNATNGAPVSGATVNIFSSTGVAMGGPTTGNDGTYTSPGLPTGTYFVRVTSSPALGSLIGQLYNGFSCPSTSCTVTKGTPINATMPSPTVVNVALQPGAQISGTVRHSVTSALLSNVSIDIFDSTGESVGSTTTNSQGVYFTPGLPTGSYYLRASPPNQSGLIGEAYNNLPCPGGACGDVLGDAVAITVPNLTENIDFSLEPGATIKGVVTHAITGAPIGAVGVFIQNALGEDIQTVTTDAQGAYVSLGLPAGDYYLVANPPAITGLVAQLHNGVPCPGNACIPTTGTPVPVSGQNAAVVNFALSPGGTISGIVTKSATGEVVSNATVHFYTAEGFEVASVTSNTSGVYVSRGLTSGTYYVQVLVSVQSGLLSQMYNNVACPFVGCSLNLGTPVVVNAPGQTSGINFALQPTPVSTNNLYANATVIPALPYHTQASVTGASSDIEDPVMSCGNGTTASSVWFTFTPSVSGPIGFNTFGSNYDTILAVYTGAPGSFVQVACNDDAEEGSQSAVIVQGVAGQKLSILVSAYTAGDFLVFNGVTVPGAPTNVTAVAGYGKATVSFTPPLNDGGSEFTEVTITASPGGATMTAYSTTAVFPGLTAGVTYTFTVTISNSVGASLPSSPSNSVTPVARPALVYLDEGDSGDAFLYNPTTGNWSRRISQPGGGFIEESSGTWNPGWTVQRADFNSDDLTDFFLYNTTSGEWAKMLNDGSGGFTTQATGGWWFGWQRFAIELDGDGITDFFLYDPGSGVWFKCFSTPGGFNYSQGGWNGGWEIYPMRLNNDAYGDLFLISRTTGRWFWVVGENGPGFTYPVSEIWFPGWQFYPGDFNGDSLGDILLHDPGTGIYFVATSTGSGFTFIQGGWSLGWNPYVMDFNADLKEDLFLHDPLTGVWFEMLSNGLGDFVNAGGEIWSLGWDILPTDVNGDGRGDIVLYHPGTGVWYQARNLVSGSFSYSSGTWPTGYVVVTRAPIR